MAVDHKCHPRRSVNVYAKNLMETALIIAVIACIILPTAFYFLGAYVQRSGDFATIELYKAEIARLTEANQSLIGSLYHRIGFKPERKTEPTVETPDRAQPNNSIDDKEHKAEGFPDLMKRREVAFAEDYKKFQESQVR